MSWTLLLIAAAVVVAGVVFVGRRRDAEMTFRSAKPLSPKEVVRRAEAFDLAPLAASTGGPSPEALRELKRVLALLALDTNRTYRLEGPLRVAWSALARDPRRLEGLGRRILGKGGAFRTHHLPDGAPFDPTAARQALLADYAALFRHALDPGFLEGGEPLVISALPGRLRHRFRADGEFMAQDTRGVTLR